MLTPPRRLLGTGKYGCSATAGSIAWSYSASSTIRAPRSWRSRAARSTTWTPTFTPIQYLRETNDRRSSSEQSGKHAYDRAGSYTISVGTRSAPIFQDKRVRQALSHLVDKTQRLSTSSCSVWRTRSSRPALPGTPEYNRRPRALAVRSRRGRQLLAEAGWRDTRRRRHPRQGRSTGSACRCASRSSPNSGNDESREHRPRRRSTSSSAPVSTRASATLDWSILLQRVNELRLRRRDHRLAARHRAARPLPDLALVAGRARRLEPHGFVRTPRPTACSSAYRRRVRRGQAQGALRPLAGDHLRRAALHVACTRRSRLHGLRSAFPGRDLVSDGANREIEWWVPPSQQKYR